MLRRRRKATGCAFVETGGSFWSWDIEMAGSVSSSLQCPTRVKSAVPRYDVLHLDERGAWIAISTMILQQLTVSSRVF